MRKICSIYRSSKEEGLYLYVEKAEGVERVPEQLLSKFGTPQLAMTLLIDEEKKLAKADAKKVLAAIADQGFYLQMPPVKEGYVVNYHSRDNTQE